MKITKKNKNRNKKTSLLLVVIAGLALVSLVLYLTVFKGSLFGWQPFGSTAVEPVTQSSSDTSHGTKEDANNPTDSTTDQVPVSDTLIATIDNLSQADGFITFLGSINDKTTGGSCSIVFSNPNDRPISRTVNAVVNNGKAVCGPIKIAETEFSYLGEWTMTFRYYSGKSQAVAERQITIQ